MYAYDAKNIEYVVLNSGLLDGLEQFTGFRYNYVNIKSMHIIIVLICGWHLHYYY